MRAFQRARDLEPTGRCDLSTWHALEETEHALGDRLLYLTEPMFRGDDVADLQLRLGSLGFDSGRIDGIFGVTTERALAEFQTNAGLVNDQVCGPDSIRALRHLATRGRPESIAGVREREQLHVVPIADVGVAVAYLDPALASTSAIAADDLMRTGCRVQAFTGTSWSMVAQLINDAGADLCVALSLLDHEACEVAYFATEGFRSAAGERFASGVIAELPAVRGWRRARLLGRRSPILRETKATAVLVALGPEDLVAQSGHLIGTALSRAVERWSGPGGRPGTGTVTGAAPT